MPKFGLSVLLALICAVLAAPSALARDVPTLEARAILPADATAPAPFPGAPNVEPIAAAGATQPVGGFSALLDAAGRNTFWAMPDNGFGSMANSRSFLLRVYRVRANFETRRGGSGQVEILGTITLRDPDDKIPFAIVLEATSDRLLTGADFDVESMRVAPDGSLWFGEEFGPFLVHTDATGKVLEAPIPTPGVKSPDFPATGIAEPVAGPANLARSNGFEGMAISEDGRKLYPVLEGPVTGDDQRNRRLFEFDIATRKYSPIVRGYRVADPSYLVADLTILDGTRAVSLERDNFQGIAAVHKRGFVVDLKRTGRDGALIKREVVDLLDLADPARISLPARPGDIGLGNPFSMPYVTIESVLPLGRDRLAIVNDTNFGSTGRNPGLADYSDFVVVDVPDLDDRPRRAELTVAVIGDTPYGDAQEAAFPSLSAAINADRRVERVLHLGDIKNGSSTCDDARFERLRGLFDGFRMPFVLTPGDNDWTDCHRANNGGYIPTERLAAFRRIFYPRPGVTLGARKARVTTQASDRRFRDYVENQLWEDEDVVFSMLHVVGSNNDLAPWFGAAETPQQKALRLAEFEARQTANLDWVDRTFRSARGEDAVVIAMQADTFFPGGVTTGFDAVIKRISDLARNFDGPVLLLQGDSHRFTIDAPIAAAPNLTRIVVEGETIGEWLRLEIDPDSPGVFTVAREGVG